MIYLYDSLQESATEYLNDLSTFNYSNEKENDITADPVYTSFVELLSKLKKSIYKRTEEIKYNIYDELDKLKKINFDTIEINNTPLSTLSITNTVSDINYEIERFINSIYSDFENINDYINEIRGSKVIIDKSYTKEELCELINTRWTSICKALETVNDLIGEALQKYPEFVNAEEFNDYKTKLIIKFNAIIAYIVANSIAAEEIYLSCAKINNSTSNLNEDSSNSEDEISDYMDELDACINDIRDFYDKFKYKEIIIPRKKKIDKMREYLLGALMRKYTLKVPLYKVIGNNTDVKNIVESEFIKPLNDITDNKYNKFIIMSPDFAEDSDMYIYLTLREPFESKDDGEDKENQTQNESVSLNEEALTSEERKTMDDSDFGLPELRAYPINDRTHIVKAIQFFDKCKEENKSKLAKNIAKKIIKLKLVGSITVSEDNKNIKYFPTWMSDKEARLKIDNEKYTIISNDKEYNYTLHEAVSSLEFII